MIHKMFSIHDTKAHAYLPPFILPEEDMAIRTFADCINSKDHQFSLHPYDYTLFKIATFDDNSGEITPLISPMSLGNGVEWKIHPTLPDSDRAETTPEETPLSNEPPILTSPESGNSA